MRLIFNGAGKSEPNIRYYMTNPDKIKYDEVGEEELKILFRKYVESTWFWRKDLVRNIVTSKYDTFCCYHIELKSYYQTRKVTTKIKQYNNSRIDSKIEGETIDPFKFEVGFPTMFEETIQYFVLPHSECIIVCDDCGGNGRVLCESCKNGYVECEFCQPPNSPNYLYPPACKQCLGRGRKMCKDCSGTGTRICQVCIGSGKKVEYSELVVNYYTLNLDDVINPTELHYSKIKGCDGYTMIDVEDEKLRHFEWSDYPKINESVNELLRSADDTIKYYDGALIQQRAIIRMIPLSHISTTTKYDIYCIGTNRKLESPNYPSSCLIM